MAKIIRKCFVLLLVAATVFSCKKDEAPVANGTVKGVIDKIGSMTLGGVKILLQNIDDPEKRHVAISNSNGTFEIEDVYPGRYYLQATKEGCVWNWTTVNGTTYHRDYTEAFEIQGGIVTNISVLMSGAVQEGDFQVLDMNGNPVSRITVRNGSTSTGFQLFNGTGERITWTFDYRQYLCHSIIYNESTHQWTDDVVQCISSVNAASGVLEPGESVPIVCYIDARTYTYEMSQYGPATIRYNGSRVFGNQNLYFDFERQ